MSSPTLWREIDALGGSSETLFDQGYSSALGLVFAILDRRGFTEHANALTAMQPEIDAAVLAERERCAEVADRIAECANMSGRATCCETIGEDIAFAIRQGPTHNVEDRT